MNLSNIFNESELFYRVNTSNKRRVSSYNEPTMKTKNIFSACIFLLVTLILLLVITNFNPPVVAAKNTETTILQQVTPTPSVDNASEIGSTDGILIMGIVIVLIVTLPMFFQKRK